MASSSTTTTTSTTRTTNPLRRAPAFGRNDADASPRHSQRRARRPRRPWQDHARRRLLRATGVFRAHQALVDRVMDSNDQERERGITILAKAASVTWRGTKINLVDTPGHADFGGEVERALAMVDGVLLLVDAAEGPLPQTRYVLSKALARDLPAVVVLNKVDRSDARPTRCSTRSTSCSSTSTPPTTTSSSRSSRPSPARAGRCAASACPTDDADLSALLDTILETIPAPDGRSGCAAAGAGHQPRRLRLPRPPGHRPGRRRHAAARRDRRPAARRSRRRGGRPRPLKRRLAPADGVRRASAATRSTSCRPATCSSSPASPRSRSATPSPTPTYPEPLPRLIVDEPVLRMTFGVNTVAAGRQGRASTSPSATFVERLEREVLGNVSIKLTDTDSPDVIEVAGRGELQLAVLIESMRREGYELAGQPARGHHHARSTASATSRSSAASSTFPTSTSAPSPRRSRPARAGSPTCAPATRPHHRHLRGARRAASSASGRCC